MPAIPSEIEEFPSCEGCIYYVNYECTKEVEEGEEPLDLMDCYQGKNDKYGFINPSFERWWVKNIRGSN